MTKKRTINEYRQTKEYYTKNPWALHGVPRIGSEGVVESETDDYEEEIDDESNSYYEFMKKLKDLRKQYPNDQEFGKRVAMIIK
jgi:hypothetical protein|tara:strand:- start:2568 stop:2819 length:252 start_codon:yes stop_codon:yes gene_type:complete